MITQMMSRNWRELIRPKAITLDLESSTDFYGKFTCEPLERGFGITIGNSLRRVLLASLQGAAITAVKMEGALHEFTAIPDVVEDVTDIILNVKRLLVKMHGDEPRTLKISRTGPGTVTAADVQGDSRCEVVNSDLLLCTLNAGATFEMELTVRRGRGYVSPDSFTHGTSAQRARWFRRGFSGGDPQACDTFAADQP